MGPLANKWHVEYLRCRGAVYFVSTSQYWLYTRTSGSCKSTGCLYGALLHGEDIPSSHVRDFRWDWSLGLWRVSSASWYYCSKLAGVLRIIVLHESVTFWVDLKQEWHQSLSHYWHINIGIHHTFNPVLPFGLISPYTWTFIFCPPKYRHRKMCIIWYKYT